MKPELLRQIEAWLNCWRSFLVGILTSIAIGFIYNWSAITTVLKSWETLFGAIIGSMLPILIAILWNPVKSKFKTYESLKNDLREVEIETTQIINDIYDLKIIYIDFKKNIQHQVGISKNNPHIGPLLFNTPPRIYIYSNPKLGKSRTGSIYLHNVLISLDKWVRQCNAMMDNIIESTTDIQNSFGTAFNKLPHPHQPELFNSVKNNYNAELLRFVEQLQSTDVSFDNGLEAAITAKVCGSKLNNWNRTFIYSTFLKRFDKEYRTFHKTEEAVNVEITHDMYAAVGPLIQKDINALIEKINTAKKP
jgi:hypothetical protein